MTEKTGVIGALDLPDKPEHSRERERESNKYVNITHEIYIYICCISLLFVKWSLQIHKQLGLQTARWNRPVRSGGDDMYAEYFWTLFSSRWNVWYFSLFSHMQKQGLRMWNNINNKVIQ